jgi:hypothetical protein
MFKQAATALAIASLAIVALDAQAKREAKTTTYDIAVTTAEEITYTGTMELAVDKGTVTGTMKITSPGEINGTVAGTSKAGKMNLDFPYHYVAESCEGRVAIEVTVPEKSGPDPLKGTVSITGCGRPDNDPLPGTIELRRQAPGKKAR